MEIIEDPLLKENECMIESDSVMSDPSQAPAKKASRFNFNELGIAPRTTLTWYNDSSFTCEVIDDHNVLFNGEQTTLSRIASDKLGYNVNGALYFVYEGKTISQIREEKQSEKVEE